MLEYARLIAGLCVEPDRFIERGLHVQQRGPQLPFRAVNRHALLQQAVFQPQRRSEAKGWVSGKYKAFGAGVGLRQGDGRRHRCFSHTACADANDDLHENWERSILSPTLVSRSRSFDQWLNRGISTCGTGKAVRSSRQRSLSMSPRSTANRMAGED